MKIEYPKTFKIREHNVDLCVVGGGMTGICAAISAARHGADVVLMHDRPVLGGNSSSECRMHICGADRSGSLPHLRETGILEELRLLNVFYNPRKNFSLWDLILYETVMREQRITLLLNCSCNSAETEGKFIKSISGWQTTTQMVHRVNARIFADCSGDSILAPLTGAPFRTGRESRKEFNESIAPENADKKTMGLTCMFQARPTNKKVSFHPPSWIYRFNDCSQLPYGAKGHQYWDMGYWWIELGGEIDTIHDTEALRHELLRITLGVWDHIKNSGHHPDSANWEIEWLQFLPAKRESRRYIGAYILTQNDIQNGGKFSDTVAYGGWPMDDHDPAGFFSTMLGRPATIFHPAHSPYGIPYRILYSPFIKNLMFAGRNASCTHTAMSSTRVMGTCAVMGQAVGTAAAIACKKNILPADIQKNIKELQQILLNDDCYLPNIKKEIPAITKKARLSATHGNPQPLRDGITRQIGNNAHCWYAKMGGNASYTFAKEEFISGIELVLDTGMDKTISSIFANGYPKELYFPPEMPRAFRIEIKKNGKWSGFYQCTSNIARLVKIHVHRKCEGVRFILDKTWGKAEISRVYEFILK